MAYRLGDMTHTDNYKCRIGDHSECDKTYRNEDEAPTSPIASDLDQRARELVEQWATNFSRGVLPEEKLTKLTARITAALQAEREAEQRRRLEMLESAVSQLGYKAAAALTIGYLQSELGMVKSIDEVRAAITADGD